MPTNATAQGQALGGVTAAFTPTNAAQAAALKQVNNAFSPISASSLSTPQNAAPVPPAPTPTDYSSAVSSGNSVIGANNSSLASTGTSTTDPMALLDSYLKGSTPPPSAADQYATDYANAGIDQKTAAANQDAASVKAAQAALNATTAQIQGLTAQGTALKLNQENTFGTTGNTVGQQAQIDRNMAVKAIPLQIQALAQQAQVAAAQGNAQLSQNILNQAQQHLDTVYKIHSQDATNQYNYQTSLRNSVFQFATQQQQNQLAAQQKAADRAFTTQQNDLNYAQSLASDAIKNGQSGVASKILALDPTSSTYRTDVANLATQISTASAGGYVGLPQAPVSVVQTSTGTSAVTPYALKAGEDPYVIAQQNGTDMATLQKLNPNIQGTQWNNLPVGATINLPNQDASWLNGKSSTQVQAYNSLPAADKSSVQQLVTGNALLSDLVKSRGIQGTAAINKLISQAQAVDPSFSVNTNKQRYLYQTQFNNPNGKEQTQINAINTGLGHLAEFKAAGDALGNAALLPYNQFVNYLKNNAGEPSVANFNTVVNALAGELAAVYKNGGAPTDQETASWRNSLIDSFSKSQFSGVTDTTAKLISNKLQSMADTYKNVMGSYPNNPIVSPTAIQQLIDVGANVSPITSRLQTQGYDVPSLPSQSATNSTLSNYGLGNSSVNSILGQYGL
jgi:hypothetical protein